MNSEMRNWNTFNCNNPHPTFEEHLEDVIEWWVFDFNNPGLSILHWQIEAERAATEGDIYMLLLAREMIDMIECGMEFGEVI